MLKLSLWFQRRNSSKKEYSSKRSSLKMNMLKAPKSSKKKYYQKLNLYIRNFSKEIEKNKKKEE